MYDYYVLRKKIHARSTVFLVNMKPYPRLFLGQEGTWMGTQSSGFGFKSWEIYAWLDNSGALAFSSNVQKLVLG